MFKLDFLKAAIMYMSVLLKNTMFSIGAVFYLKEPSPCLSEQKHG